MGLVVSHLVISPLRDKVCELAYRCCARLERILYAQSVLQNRTWTRLNEAFRWLIRAGLQIRPRAFSSSAAMLDQASPTAGCANGVIPVPPVAARCNYSVQAASVRASAGLKSPQIGRVL